MPQHQPYLPLFAVTLNAAPMDVIASSKAQAMQYGEDDVREFSHLAPFDVTSVSLAPPGAEPSPAFDSITPDIAVENIKGRDYRVSGTYRVVVAADEAYSAGQAALAMACTGEPYEKSLQTYEAAVAAGRVPLLSSTAVEKPVPDHHDTEEASTPCPT